MLTALINKKIFTTIHHSRDELRRIRHKGHSFICPYCSSTLNLRIGSQNVPHFSHHPQSDCEAGNQYESPKHLLSKQLLYNKINSLYNGARLEHYIKEIKQIADIYVNTDSRKIAVEIQCSNIPIPEIQQRTKGYQSQKITPFWILTQPVKHRGLLKLSSFQQAFIRYSPHLDYFLFHFLPEISSFQLFTHLLPVSASVFMSSKPITIPIEHFSLPLSIPREPFHQTSLLNKWNSHRMKWLHTKLHYNKAGKDTFLKEVYGEGDTFLYLPLYIGLPVIPYGIHIKSHVVEWQYYIWKDCLKKEDHFSEDSVCCALYRRLTRGSIELRSLPLVENDEVIEKIVRGYLFLLAELKVLKRMNNGQFHLSEPLRFPDHLSSFERHQHDFFPKWKHILKKL